MQIGVQRIATAGDLEIEVGAWTPPNLPGEEAQCNGTQKQSKMFEQDVLSKEKDELKNLTEATALCVSWGSCILHCTLTFGLK